MATLADMCAVPQELLRAAEIEKNRRRVIQMGIDGDRQRKHNLDAGKVLASKMRSVSGREIISGQTSRPGRARVTVHVNECGHTPRIVATKRFDNSYITVACRVEKKL